MQIQLHPILQLIQPASLEVAFKLVPGSEVHLRFSAVLFEGDAVICWLTGYSQEELQGQLKKQTDFETFFKEAPKLNPSRTLIKGVICGVRVEDIQEPTMREIRYLDKLVDELAKGKAMEKILRA